nr:MAG TPA: hypothetical protein [Caudoviricetes sp.]DAM80554.1 MAG TPA: hypothetical protein [Caudoviricetes sp.]
MLKLKFYPKNRAQSVTFCDKLGAYSGLIRD